MKDIPVLHVAGDTLATAYELALFELYRNGSRMTTQYDKLGDPASIDATMNITIQRPEADPMIHKAFPGGIEDLREYVLELLGAKDHWVKNMDDPKDTRWEYTYHGRLANWGTYRVSNPADASGWQTEVWVSVDQIAAVVEKLAAQPFTRQAQMVTWMPPVDMKCYDPPCLQSLWYRIVQDDDGTWYLNCNVRFRSNDAWGASFMNMFGFIQFNLELIAKPISELTGLPVKLGRMNWHADSFHIYGKDIAQARSLLFDRVQEPLADIEARVFNFQDEWIREIYEDATSKVLTKILTLDEEHGWTKGEPAKGAV